MKVQITRFSPKQNAKVVAVLMAIASLAFAVPMFLAFSFMPATDAQGNPVPAPPALIFLLFPFVYLVMGFVFVAVACWLYNVMYKHIGGIEYETNLGNET